VAGVRVASGVKEFGHRYRCAGAAGSHRCWRIPSTR
jgi:hypothetical protein